MITEYNIEQLFKTYFGSKPYKVPGLSPVAAVQGYEPITKNNQVTQVTGSTLLTQYLGAEIWLPVWFRGLPEYIGDGGVLFLPYTVVKISGKKTIISTPLAERRGSVHEQYNIDDYDISIKGFLIDQKRVWPEEEIKDLKLLYEDSLAVILDNALTNAFLDQGDKVIIKSFELPEVEGGRKHVRPFSMQLESDSVFTLEVE